MNFQLAFMTNGNDIYFLDAGLANKRLVSGFFSAAECEYNVR
jgi:hypothetical protein